MAGLNRRSAGRSALAVLVVVGLVGGAVGPFVVAVDDAKPDPVAFEDTVELGLPLAIELQAGHVGASVPKAEVFFSGYRYVVGYRGVGQAVGALGQPHRHRQFGYPLAIYVSDYAGTGATVDADGHLVTDRRPTWTDARDASYVVDSGAGVAGNSLVVPFGSAAAAEAFAADHGGAVVDWSDLRERSFDGASAGVVRRQVADRASRADERVAAAKRLLDREVSVVVGEDVPTVAEAIDAAPPNTTVVVPAGTYEETVEVDKPVTLRGANATLRGDGNGTVVRVTADDVAVAGFAIEGVGNRTDPPDDVEADDWDYSIERGYGYGDAGVAAIEANGTYVADVRIETPANGVLLRDAPGAVVAGIDVNGSDDWLDGFMGVMAMRSPSVVQNSRVDGGRDGVYLHRSHGTVIRDNTFLGERFGVHLMYTSDTLVADNAARGHEYAGVVVMTSPSGNAIVDNDVRGSGSGVLVSGSDSYVAGNVFANNRRGIGAGTTRSLYEHNVVYGNDVGLDVQTVVPSNRIVANDFVANDRPADPAAGSLYVLSHDGRGNYWDGAYGDASDGVLDRPYAPSDPVDGRLHRTAAATTIAESPAARGIRGLIGTAPGLRHGSVVDVAPLADPANPGVLAAVANRTENEANRAIGGVPA